MTVIRPNSVSGITSITAQANEINFFRSNGALAGLQLNGVNFNTTTGVSTFNNLDVGGVLTYQDVTNVDSIGIVTARSGINITGGNITLGDSGSTSDDRLVFGAGSDLSIYHNGSNSYIDDTGTGNLFIRSNEVRINKYTNEYMIRAIADGAVELYHDNSKKFETTSNGISVTGSVLPTGNVKLGDSTNSNNNRFIAGAGDDLQIYHSGSSSWVYDNGTGPLYLATNNSNVEINGGGSANDTMAKFKSTEGVELYYNNLKKLETESGGAIVTDNDTSVHIKMVSSAGTAGYLYGASNNNIGLLTNSGSYAIKGIQGGSTEIYHNNDKKFMTQSDGVRVEDGGHLYFANDSENASSAIRNVGGSGSSTLVFTTGGGDRWQILNGGHLVPQANNAYDIGESSYRVRNIYTNDLNLSNEGSTNSVDNTWGNYTIQEGESDLFLINNRSGKKYKFNLTEVV